MNDAPRFALADWLCLLLVVAAAAGVRVWYVAVYADNGTSEPHYVVQGQGPVRDGTTEIADLAQHVRDERWFGGLAPLSDQPEETAHVAPGYPWLLGILGRWHDDPAMLMRWAQCGLGVLTVLCCFVFVRHAFSSTVAAVIAGLLAALHPFWIANTAEIADGVLVCFLLSAVLATGGRGSTVGGAFTSLLFGLSLAGLAMVRAALLPFALVAFVWYLARCRDLRSGWFAGLLALLGFANGLAPWVVRNYQVFGTPVPIADSTYLHLWMGNCRMATGATLDEKRLRLSLEPEVLETLLADQDQPHRYARLGPELLDLAAQRPGVVLRNRLDAGMCFLLGGDWPAWHRLGRSESGGLGMRGWFEPALCASLLILLPLAFCGWRHSAGWAKQSRLAALAAVWLPLPYLLSHAEDLSGPRLPFDAILICYAAFAIASMVPGVARTPEEAEARAAAS
jgi:hypothetical protein